MTTDSAPPGADSGEVTGLLREWSAGDAAALEQLAPLIYAELRRLARRAMGRERQDHTLEATALAHEAFVRLLPQQEITWQNRAHFFAIAARMMHRVLTDYARQRSAQRRPPPSAKVSLTGVAGDFGAGPDVEALAVHQVLEQLAALDARQAEIVQLRFFGGLTNEEIAHVLELSVATVERDWRFARAWMRRELARRPGGTEPPGQR